jgi:hypothetical protein
LNKLAIFTEKNIKNRPIRNLEPIITRLVIWSLAIDFPICSIDATFLYSTIAYIKLGRWPETQKSPIRKQPIETMLRESAFSVEAIVLDVNLGIDSQTIKPIIIGINVDEYTKTGTSNFSDSGTIFSEKTSATKEDIP